MKINHKNLSKVPKANTEHIKTLGIYIFEKGQELNIDPWNIAGACIFACSKCFNDKASFYSFISDIINRKSI